MGDPRAGRGECEACGEELGRRGGRVCELCSEGPLCEECWVEDGHQAHADQALDLGDHR